MVKITDVAKLANVAKSTVSNVLSGKKFVSEDLKEKVLKACKELDYQPSFFASRLSLKKTQIIALLIEVTDNINDLPFYGDLMISCLLEASKHGYSLLTYYDQDNEKYIQTIKQGRAPIDGAIVMAPSVNDERLLQMKNDAVHTVLIGRPNPKDVLSYVDVNNNKLVYDVVLELSQKYDGDIYLLNADEKLTISIDRDKGFKKAFAFLDKRSHDNIFHHTECNEEYGYKLAKTYLKKNDVFLTANEKVAMGVYRAIEDAGLVVGKDVAVFSLGRSISKGSFTPKLSYGKQDYKEIGKRAIEILVGEIESENPIRHIYIESKLNYSESTER